MQLIVALVTLPRYWKSQMMNIVMQKGISLLKSIKDWYSNSLRDAPYFGYIDAVRWHSIPLCNQVRYYLRRPLLLSPVKFRLPGCEHPIWLRPRTSDYQVYRQVFVDQEYGDLEGLTDVRFVIDGGANIGLVSVYLLNRFRQATVLAVEPDKENLSICRRNLAPYGSRAMMLQGGLWSHRTRLAVVPSEFGGGNKWGIRVRPLRDGANDCEAVEGYDVHSLLVYANMKHVDILKVDIERSELSVFSASANRWLSRIRNLVIELHGEDCCRVFFAALERFKYRLSQRGDLTYCLDLEEQPTDTAILTAGTLN